LSDKNKKGKITFSFNKVFRIFLKTGKKRLLITIFTGLMVFLAITTFFVTWYSYRYKFFNDNYIGNYDFRSDNRVSSVRYTTQYSTINLPSYYMTYYSSQLYDDIDTIMPGVVSNYTVSISAPVYTYVNETEEFYTHEISSLDNESILSIFDNLVEGRAPQNSSEIIYIRSLENSTYNLTDTIHLYGRQNVDLYTQNLTIVGIIENPGEYLYYDGFSRDVVKRYSEYGWPMYEDPYSDIFITSFDYFRIIMSDFDFYNGELIHEIDFNYQFKASHVRSISTYLKNFNQYMIANYYEYDFCNDVRYLLMGFNYDWMAETSRTFSSSIPILFLFGLVAIETFKIGNYEMESKFKLLKIQGLEYKSIRRMISLENFIISTSCLLGGAFLGTFIGYFAFMGMGYTSFTDYILSIIEPVVFVTIFLLFMIFFIGGYLIENSLAKKTTKLTAVRFKSKRGEKLRKFFSATEVLMFLPGLGFIAIGFTGMYLIPLFGYGAFGYLEDYLFQLQLSFIVIIAIGLLFILASVFLLFSRLLALFWNFIGKKAWMNTKSYFTLSLKHLSIYSKNYQRVMLVAFMIGLGLTPGLILNKSIDDHISMEAQLGTGFSDMIIYNWPEYLNFYMHNLTDIEGIEAVTQVSLIYLNYYSWGEYYYRLPFHMRLLSIHNVTEYLQIINPELFDHTIYDQSDIEELANNMTYLMSKKYASKNDYDKDRNFTSALWHYYYQVPYNMSYVNSFEIFPLLDRIGGGVAYYELGDIFNLVTSKLTSDQLLNKTSSDVSISQNNYVMIKTTPNANYTYIKQELFLNLGLQAITPSEYQETLDDYVSNFGKNYFIFASVITVIITIFYGYITARNNYYQRIRVIESEYQIGAKKRQIWSSFTIELLFILLMPIVLSFGVTIPILRNVIPYLLVIQNEYIRFAPWLPWWIILIIIVLSYGLILGGWLLEIIPQVRKYRPIKQE